MGEKGQSPPGAWDSCLSEVKKFLDNDHCNLATKKLKRIKGGVEGKIKFNAFEAGVGARKRIGGTVRVLGVLN